MGLSLKQKLQLLLLLRKVSKMPFKFAIGNVVAAIIAGATAFGGAWTLAATNATPGVQPNEYGGILFAVLPAVIGAFYHNADIPKQ